MKDRGHRETLKGDALLLTLNETFEQEPDLTSSPTTSREETPQPGTPELKERAHQLDIPGPAVWIVDGKPMCQLVRASFHPVHGDMKVSEAQQYALDKFEEAANRVRFKLDHVQGDIQYVNNLGLLHARSSWTDNGIGSRRHMLRMFLRDPEYVWAKPKDFEFEFNDPFDANRPQHLPVVETDPCRLTSGSISHG
jgi:hypothetical protein